MVGVLWVVVGACNTVLLDRGDRFLPIVPTLVFLLAGISTMLFALRPWSEHLFIWAGGLTVVALFMRGVTVIGNVFLRDDPDAWWISVPSFIINLVLFLLYWWFWQEQVKPWHIYYERLRNLKN